MQFEDVQITDAQGLHWQIEAAVREKHGFPRVWIVRSQHGTEEFHYNPKRELTFLKSQLERGNKVYLRLQVTSVEPPRYLRIEPD